MRIKYSTQNPLSPKRANAVVYNMFSDFHPIRKGHDCYTKLFSIKNLRKDGFALSIQILPERTVKERGEQYGLKIKAVEYSVERKMPDLSDVKGFEIRFTSPTSFYYNGIDVPYFDPYIFWQGALCTYKKLKEREPLLNAKAIMQIARLEQCECKTEKLMLDDNIPFSGFTGAAKFNFTKFTPCEAKIFMYCLLEMLEYMGAGRKTGWGMGNVEFNLL
ncbi:hypothetical protein AN618_22450 [Fervidicola ferrireducens]|uniref:CRISPR-associated protein Cas6 C-terminal domain-containing protein n=2 Tax=Fervidicola ferrireducens TaxID=520764 RepID=A0A140L223_9FIRM|nr:hypothetical protein AN618_22450 [Fervidicola ferrireducens]